MARTAARGARPLLARLSAVELAVGFALLGSILAVAIPTFARDIHASRTVEPVDGLVRIGASAVEYARTRAVGEAFPAPAPLTPGVAPRGVCAVDPPGTWDQPTWIALAFTPAPEGAPHCFAFEFDSHLAASSSTFVAQAHGDLDGDGLPSTFEIHGHAVDHDPRGPAVDSGMFIDSEVE